MTSRRIRGTFLSRWDRSNHWNKRDPQTKGDPKLLTAPLISYAFDPPALPDILIDVPPWGMLMPAESLENGAPFYAIVDATHVPSGTEFIVRAAIENGATHEARYTYFDVVPPDVYIEMPNGWFWPAIGKHIVVDFDAVFPDGETFTSPPTTFRIHPFLEISPILYEGLGFGEPLDPDAFPDGLVATLDRVRNMETFHEANVRFLVFGYTENGTRKVIAARQFKADDLGVNPLRATLEPAFYSGHYESGELTDIHIEAELYAHMIPRPGPWAQMRFLLGTTDILPPGK
ncbi:hypothetical protein PAQ31011_01744 [Pandoraea aquatica]|uniref:Uncharacterized protein n=1 Tax=Pandoraea aquatica TaxID=2508290 RepID=A0A5E4U0V9_9BURK|nr:hypothetical protein [Pandoraea aquatica]VVD93163.1 hypothetical protein PAQ31011_01744 [Pandoraea aquatica]